MSIHVICPGCHARFKVSDKFAGKQGPCPKCKKKITVPAKDEVVVHEPEGFEGQKDAAGRLVLKPDERVDSSFSPVITALVIIASLFMFIIALVVRLSSEDGKAPPFVLAMGAVVLAPPLVFGGYMVLRDHELEPYRGVSLGIRGGICALIYALVWGGYAVTTHAMFGESPVEIWHLTYLIPPCVVIGATTAFACLELDPTSSTLHYGFYLAVTVLLRLAMGMSAF